MPMRIKPDAFQDCVRKIMAVAGVDQQKAEEMLNQTVRQGDLFRQEGVEDPFAAAAREAADKAKEEAKRDRIDAVRNAMIRAEKMKRVTDIGTAWDKLRQTLHWVAGADNMASAEGKWHALSRSFTSQAANVARTTVGMKAALSGAFDKEIAEALWRGNGGAPNQGIKISAASQAFADKMAPILENSRLRLNNAGARIGKALDYVASTAWDPRQLRLAAGKGADFDAAFEAWWAKDGPRMAEKTFEDLVPHVHETEADARKRFGRSVFEGRVTGVVLDQPSSALGATEQGGYVPPAFEGTHNLARSVSQQRTVYWKTAQDWLDHMHEFGGGNSLFADLVHNLDGSGRRIALMEEWGTNPGANLNMVIDRLQKKFRGSDPDGVVAFQSKAKRLQNVMGRLDGSLNVPVNSDWAEWFRAYQTWQATAHLGGVSLTHLAAAPMSVSAELSHQGVRHIEGIVDVMKALTSGRGPDEVQERMAEAGAYTHGMHVALQSVLRPGSSIPGYMSYWASMFMKMTGLPRFIDGLQAKAVKGVLMDKLGADVGNELSAIDPARQKMLRAYGIDDNDWRLLRSAQDPLMVDGRRYVTPHDAMTIPDAVLEDHLATKGTIPDRRSMAFPPEDFDQTIAPELQKYRWQLGDKLLMYLNDSSERATVTPGVKEQEIWLRGTQAGTINDTILKAFSQFKMWPTAAVNQIWMHAYRDSLSARGAAANLFWILGLSAIGGALRMAVNDLAAGRPQHNYRDPNTWLASLAQGGGLGIYGDFLFGEVNRMGGGAVGTIGGPTAGDVDRLMKIYDRFRNDIGDSSDPTEPGHHVHKAGRFADIWPDLAHFAVGHVPFANLIYLKGALDYLLWYHLYEAASPGWWERTNRRMQKEQGRPMMGYVPGAGVPAGLPYLYMQNHYGQSFGLLGSRQQ